MRKMECFIIDFMLALTPFLSSLPTECDAGYYRASGGTCQPCPANSNRASNQNETFCMCGDNRVTASGNPRTTGAACDGKLILVCFRVQFAKMEEK